jgi:hypothetical protein
VPEQQQKYSSKCCLSYGQAVAGIPNKESNINGIDQLSQNMTDFLGKFKRICFPNFHTKNSMILKHANYSNK